MGGKSIIPAWNPIHERFYDVSLEESHLYIKISKKKFEEIKKDLDSRLIDKIEEDHFRELKADRPTPSDYKANLSA